MYSIVLADGKIININADKVEWYLKDRMIRLFNDGQIVARINMDNVVGWIDADFRAETAKKTRCQPGSSDWLYEV